MTSSLFLLINEFKDVQWNDIDYMDSNNDFTISNDYKNLSNFIEEVHSSNMFYIPIVDCGISANEKTNSYYPYELGIQMDIFVKNSSDKLLIGKVIIMGDRINFRKFKF